MNMPRALANGAALFAWGASFVAIFQHEWQVNEQYSYGFLVPLLTAYLIYLRWGDRPAARPLTGWPARVAYIGIGLAFVALWPILTILEANPEWRMALWAFGLSAYGLILLSLAGWGGWRWAVYFAVPLALLLFAIPWPMRLEQPLVQQLMRMVTAVTVECLNLAGIYAEQQGNLIRLSNSWVGVEEACSGVRSFQSTLMGAYFLGELFRWAWWGRVALITLACGVSLLLNLFRTLTLALITADRGPEAMEVIHDPVGHAVAIGSFLCLFSLAWGISRLLRKPEDPAEAYDREREVPAGQGPAPDPMPHWWPLSFSLATLALVPLAWGGQWLWYARAENLEAERLLAEMHWERLPGPPEFVELTPNVQNMLRYSEGAHTRWIQPDGSRVTSFFFRWDAGRISAHASVHRPEVCLPAAGFTLEEEFAPLDWTLGPLEISFRAYEFQSQARSHYVFFGVWDDYPDRPVPLAATGADRLRQVWHAQRIRGRHGLQIIITGVPGIETARLRAAEILERALRLEDAPRAEG